MSTHFYIQYICKYTLDRRKERKRVKAQTTHTLRAFCLQTSRAVTPIIMEMRNRPALMPSITPLTGSAGQGDTWHSHNHIKNPDQHHLKRFVIRAVKYSVLCNVSKMCRHPRHNIDFVQYSIFDSLDRHVDTNDVMMILFIMPGFNRGLSYRPRWRRAETGRCRWTAARHRHSGDRPAAGCRPAHSVWKTHNAQRAPMSPVLLQSDLWFIEDTVTLPLPLQTAPVTCRLFWVWGVRRRRVLSPSPGRGPRAPRPRGRSPLPGCPCPFPGWCRSSGGPRQGPRHIGWGSRPSGRTWLSCWFCSPGRRGVGAAGRAGSSRCLHGGGTQDRGELHSNIIIRAPDLDYSCAKWAILQIHQGIRS